MDEKIEFSVVIPLYNKASHIRRTIDSVLAQSVKDFELIIVNDGSTDDSEKIVKQYHDPRIRLISQFNAGVSTARNRGIKKANYPYIAFLDADDVWDNDFLENIEKLIIDFPGADVYATGIRISRAGKKLEVYKSTIIPSHPWQGIMKNFFECLAADFYPISSSSVCVKKELLEKLNGFDENLKIGEDIDMWTRLFLVADIAFTTQPSAIYHRGTENPSHMQVDYIKKEHDFIKTLIQRDKNKIPVDKNKEAYRAYLRLKVFAFIQRMIQSNRRFMAIEMVILYCKYLTFHDIFELLIRSLLPIKLIKSILIKLNEKQ